MAVPKKRVSKTRGSLRHTNWKKEIIPHALKALSLGKKQARQSTQPASSSALEGTTQPATPDLAAPRNLAAPLNEFPVSTIAGEDAKRDLGGEAQ
jgi:ribosomal protein L32